MPPSLHRYTYVHNNPVKYVDPSGEFAWLAAGVVLFVAGIVFLTMALTAAVLGDFDTAEVYMWAGLLAAATGLGIIYLSLPGVGQLLAGLFGAGMSLETFAIVVRFLALQPTLLLAAAVFCGISLTLTLAFPPIPDQSFWQSVRWAGATLACMVAGGVWSNFKGRP